MDPKKPFGVRKNGEATSARNHVFGELDGMDILKRDHDSMRSLFKLYRGLEGHETQRKVKLADDIIKQLCQHTGAEEQVLYPLVETKLLDGPKLAREALDEHWRLERAMKDVMYIKPDDAKFTDLMNLIMDGFEEHFKEEEEVLFPMLQEAVDAKTLGRLNFKIVQAKMNAPTRPHPMVPRRGWAGKWASSLAATVDAISDTVTTRITRA